MPFKNCSRKSAPSVLEENIIVFGIYINVRIITLGMISKLILMKPFIASAKQL
jgi:hypothetical protein